MEIHCWALLFHIASSRGRKDALGQCNGDPIVHGQQECMGMGPQATQKHRSFTEV